MKKTPAQAATERHEDALLQKVAREEGGDPASAAVIKTVDVPVGTPAPSPFTSDTDDVVMLDESVPYATVRGIPGVEYVQGRDYFGRDKRMVREAPTEAWYFAEAPSKAKSAMAKADEARAELKRQGLWTDVPNRVPKALADIEKENARAAAAEAHAA